MLDMCVCTLCQQDHSLDALLCVPIAPPPSRPLSCAVCMLCRQDVIIVVLDVGPQMSDHLVHVRKSLFLLAESKVSGSSSNLVQQQEVQGVFQASS